MTDDRQAQKIITAAQVLREQIEELASNDLELLHDTLEGETQLHEVIEILVKGIGEDKAAIDGVKGYIDVLRGRINRLQARIDTRRGLIETGMQIGEIKRVETAVATVTLRDKAPSAIIVDEEEIPAAYWSAQAPKLDKSAVLTALKNDTKVPGASLDNGGITTSIRWR